MTKPNKKINSDAPALRYHIGTSALNLAKLLKQGDRQTLARLITLAESNRQKDQDLAWKVIRKCKSANENSIRIGVTGPPGVGKSTLIESLGMHVIKKGRKVAVLAIDPSSTISGGSILGDKTRMPNLSTNSSAFIRPSPSGGSLGGVAERTPQVIQLCELAGYDVVIVETVGVGQSETAVHAMTDFFLLLALPGSGDELQGMKRGIMEMADSVLVTKADGDNLKRANLARAQINSALHLFRAPASGWIPKAECISAVENKGIAEAWKMISDFRHATSNSGYFTKKRNDQLVALLHQMFGAGLLAEFRASGPTQKTYTRVVRQLIDQKLSLPEAARTVLDKFREVRK